MHGLQPFWPHPDLSCEGTSKQSTRMKSEIKDNTFVRQDDASNFIGSRSHSVGKWHERQMETKMYDMLSQ